VTGNLGSSGSRSDFRREERGGGAGRLSLARSSRVPGVFLGEYDVTGRCPYVGVEFGPVQRENLPALKSRTDGDLVKWPPMRRWVLG
jgi:hypothetical protein